MTRVCATIFCAGEEAWIVGGAVRDDLLGRPVVDVDVACREPRAAARRFARRHGGRAVPALRAPRRLARRAGRRRPRRSTSRRSRTASRTTSRLATSRSTRSRSPVGGRRRCVDPSADVRISRRGAACGVGHGLRATTRCGCSGRRGSRTSSGFRIDEARRRCSCASRPLRDRAGGRADPRRARRLSVGGLRRLDELGLLAPLGGSLERAARGARRSGLPARRGLRGAASSVCRSRTSCGRYACACSGAAAGRLPRGRSTASAGRPSRGRSRRSRSLARRGARAASSRRRARRIRRSRCSAATSSVCRPGPRSGVSSRASTRSGQPGRSRRARRRSSSRARCAGAERVSVALRLALQEERAAGSRGSGCGGCSARSPGTRRRSTPAAAPGRSRSRSRRTSREVVGVDVDGEYLEAARAAGARERALRRGRRDGAAVLLRGVRHRRAAPPAPPRPAAGARGVGAGTRDAARGARIRRRSARVDRSAAEPRDGPLRAAAGSFAPAAAAGGRHPRVSRRERPRSGQLGGDARACRSRAAARSAGLSDEERVRTAGRRRRRPYDVEIGGTSRGSPGPSRSRVCGCAPGPVLGCGAQTGAHGVPDDVLAASGEVVLVVDDAAREAVGEEVSEAAVALVEPLRVATVQELHAAREGGGWRGGRRGSASSSGTGHASPSRSARRCGAGGEGTRGGRRGRRRCRRRRCRGRRRGSSRGKQLRRMRGTASMKARSRAKSPACGHIGSAFVALRSSVADVPRV